MIRVVLVLLIAVVACEADAAEQVVYYNGQWWIVRSEPARQQGPTPRDLDTYKEFGDRVGEIVEKMNEVAEGRRERSDRRALAFLLRDYNQAVAEADWEKADSIAKSMKVFLVRGSAVAADAERRKTERERAEAERRHQEEMRQRERHHQEEMEQQAQQQRQQQIIHWWWHY